MKADCRECGGILALTELTRIICRKLPRGIHDALATIALASRCTDSSPRRPAEYELFSRIKELTTDRMALYISHRFSPARMADRIFLLEHGQLREHGTHDELMLTRGQYAELFELQAASYR